MIDRKLTDKVRKGWDRDYVQVVSGRIEVYWLNTCQKIWVPFSGGPLYNDQAKDAARDLKASILEFRSLLPKAIRDWPVVVGEIDSQNRFHEERTPPETTEGTGR